MQEVLQKVEGTTGQDFPARPFLIQVARKLTEPQVHDALAAVQDKRLTGDLKNPVAYFRTIAGRMMDGTV